MAKDSGGKMDPTLSRMFGEVFGQAQGVHAMPFEPYKKELVPGQNSLTQQSNQDLMRATGSDQALLARAAGMAGSVGDFERIGAPTAQAVTGDAAQAQTAQLGASPQLGGSERAQASLAGLGAVPDVQAQDATAQTGGLSGVPDVQAGQLSQTSLSPYMDPYTDSVIGAYATDMDRARQMVNNDVGAQASQVGAAFGSRQAVAEGQNNDSFLRNVGQMSANLRSQGYGQAQEAARSDIDRSLAGQTQNQNTRSSLAQLGAQLGTNVNLSNADRALSASQSNQGTRSSLAQLGAQLGTNVSLDNAARADQRGVDQAGLSRDYDFTRYGGENDMSRFNATSRQQMGLANMDARNSMANSNADRQLSAEQANQGAGLTAANQRLQAAGALADIGGDYYRGPQNLAQAGQTEFQRQQASDAANYQEFQRNQEWPFKKLDALTSAFGVHPASTPSSNSKGSTMGGIGSLLQAGAMFL